jgi:hypothetical protein
MDAFQRERKAVIITDAPADQPDEARTLRVLDFNRAAIVKTCSLPPAGEAFFADHPQFGASVEFDRLVGDPQILMTLDPARPCEMSFRQIPDEDIKYRRSDGHAGSGGAAWQGTFGGDTMVARQSGRVFFARRSVPLGIQIPPDFLGRLDVVLLSMPVNNERLVAIQFDGRKGLQTIYLCKNDNTWHSVEVPGDREPSLRAFGKYLVATERWQEHAYPPQRSLGMTEWRQAKVDSDGDELEKQPAPLLERFLNTAQIGLPGNLYVIDTDTGRQFKIETRQGDSEVLLIEDGVIYYRAASRLYSARIDAKGIGNPQFLGSDEMVFDAHWAFIKH